MNNQTEILKELVEPDKNISEEPDEAPLGLEPALSGYMCPYCGALCLDLGKEQPDQHRQERRWLQCTSSSCNNIHSIIIGPTRTEPPFKSDYQLLKKRGLI